MARWQQQAYQDEDRQRQGSICQIWPKRLGCGRHGRTVHGQNQQNAKDQSHSHRECLPLLLSGALDLRTGYSRQRTGHTIDLDCATVLLRHEIVADREPKPSSFAGRLRREERLEQPVAVLRWDPNTIEKLIAGLLRHRRPEKLSRQGKREKVC